MSTSTQSSHSDSGRTEFRPRLKSLPIRERPISRIYDVGAQSVSLTELLAAVIGGTNQLELAERLVVRYQVLSDLFNAPLAELQQFSGVGHATAARIKAALELGKRLVHEDSGDRPKVISPADAAKLVMNDMAILEKEELRVILLNTKGYVLGVDTVYIGSVNTTIVRIAEVFREAIRVMASAIIAVHNHPSGDPSPSPEDVRVTEQIVKAGEMLNVDVLDHIVIGKGRYVSLKERDLGFR